uniref:Reverse transcriptase zinc-binding domain-containing protein n=1 Tax=Quercus lobata TaxID=97700 RepID=A0A7N2MJC6_QUELO
MDLASESCVGAASDDSKQRRFWKLLWKINTPHKVRHFAWRACKDILPTKENLVRRKVLAEEWDALQIERMIIVAWALWASRNKVRIGGVKKSAPKIVNNALEHLAEYQACIKDPEKPHSVQPAFWKPPPLNKFKIICPWHR